MIGAATPRYRDVSLSVNLDARDRPVLDGNVLRRKHRHETPYHILVLDGSVIEVGAPVGLTVDPNPDCSFCTRGVEKRVRVGDSLTTAYKTPGDAHSRPGLA